MATDTRYDDLEARVAHLEMMQDMLLRLVSISRPLSNMLEQFGATNVKCRPFLVQIEQLQAVTIARSVVHSNRTMPQWQPPV